MIAVAEQTLCRCTSLVFAIGATPLPVRLRLRGIGLTHHFLFVVFLISRHISHLGVIERDLDKPFRIPFSESRDVTLLSFADFPEENVRVERSIKIHIAESFGASHAHHETVDTTCFLNLMVHANKLPFLLLRPELLQLAFLDGLRVQTMLIEISLKISFSLLLDDERAVLPRS